MTMVSDPLTVTEPARALEATDATATSARPTPRKTFIAWENFVENFVRVMNVPLSVNLELGLQLHGEQIVLDRRGFLGEVLVDERRLQTAREVGQKTAAHRGDAVVLAQG